MLTDHEIVAALVHGGMPQREAQRRLRERDANIKKEVLRSKARRDRIASSALQGLLIHSAAVDAKPSDFAQSAVAHADALIEELDK
ncbi:hypothetical protein [Paraburkholderia sartisoli]|uniref:Uncharacterized protein n=1 Tax=Paraburkholderia sartisoli TaxID=83784 RepID=A0A1H4HSG4_9BURK|nr:hypothetical protein [Paraburkholderia sartisoli]SEB24767.1 hypothetical protein SAMN05192564_11516 [Paraburkholderia sartisoli]